MSKTTVALVGIVILSAGIQGLWSAPQPDSPAVLLRAAIEKEEVDGDLNAAIEQYKRVITVAGAERAVAAQALLRLGGCYEKRGPAEARQAYQQLIRDYAEQAKEVATARQRLAALQSRAAVPGRPEIMVRRVFAIEGGGLGVDAAIEPRATFFSFRDVETGDLAIMELPGGTKRRLTNKGASPDVTQVSVPSPDGRQVAFDWWVVERSQPSGSPEARLKLRPQLRVVALDGSAPRVIYESTDASPLYPYDWSPDGGRVLAVHVLRNERVNQIVLLSVADGSKRIVATVPGLIQRISRARFSPDGRYVAFDLLAEERGGLHDVFVVTSDGSRTTPLVQQTGDDLLLDWSPDGRYIVFSSDRTGTTDAWLLPVADGKPQGAPQLIKRDLGHILPMGVARNGSFYYNIGLGGWDVYVASLDPASGNVLVPPRLVPERFLGRNVSPQWSPDGRSLFWLSRRGPMGPARNIPRIRSMETGEEHDLATGLLFLNQVSWSPDGHSLLGKCVDRSERTGVCRIDVQTGQATMILQDTADVSRNKPVGLPDGKHMLSVVNTAEGRAGGYAVALVRNLETGEEREVARVSGGLAVSPDGRQLAFGAVDPAAKERVVKIASLAGGEPRELFRAKGTATPIQWTADGRHLVVGESDHDNAVLWLVPVDDGKPLQKFTLGNGVLDPSLHADGRQVAFCMRSEAGGELWVMENFLPPAKK